MNCLKTENKFIIKNSFVLKYWLKAGNGNDQNFQGGGYFRNIFGQGGGILPEASNFDRKSRFLALLSHN